jgi:hypothetical protein
VARLDVLGVDGCGASGSGGEAGRELIVGERRAPLVAVLKGLLHKKCLRLSVAVRLQALRLCQRVG